MAALAPFLDPLYRCGIACGYHQPHLQRVPTIVIQRSQLLIPGSTLAMTAHASDSRERRHWESVHVCRNCGHIINLAELDLRAITTGIVTCPGCDWSGQIEIQVIDQVPRKKPTSVE